MPPRPANQCPASAACFPRATSSIPLDRLRLSFRGSASSAGANLVFPADYTDRKIKTSDRRPLLKAEP